MSYRHAKSCTLTEPYLDSIIVPENPVSLSCDTNKILTDDDLHGSSASNALPEVAAVQPICTGRKDIDSVKRVRSFSSVLGAQACSA